MTLQTIEGKLERINGTIEGVKKDITYIRKEIEGNGSEGLRKETTRNSNFRIASKARAKFIGLIVGGGGIIAILIFILSKVL